MRLFEIQPGEVSGKNFSIWHLDLDHVVCMREMVKGDDDRYRWWVEMSNNQNFFVTQALFDRLMRAWESN